ncbi:M48 family metallopeptidase [Jannaschia formosa]|uniref:M48 family metallopeptidase n=1 Tax=Jannaschia formosa TaxID=2259592 RepID=UPI000E1C3677|nr:M48 family metallopeptidase [Jannaschia formosa]TFL19122.1 peptidase M48 [Jannaschia formosa]
MRRTILAALSALLLVGCQIETGGAPAPVPAPPPVPATDRVSSATAVANFRDAVARVEPAAESLCRDRAPRLNCDFLIRVDPDPRLPPNAFQSLDRSGRPVLTFTRALIAEARNQDEIAFVIGHEAAHHVEEHIARQRDSATAGLVIGAAIGSVLGGDQATVEGLARAGSQVGARRFSKEHELEADALGTIITARAGYDPIRGAAFFTRIPDPGDRFLGTHPPNADRIAVVRRVASTL